MQEKRINDFCITFGTVNGSGSATANNALLRALFKMGVPVSGKNIFPSNIQGLATWYSIRLSKDGYFGRVEKDDIVVAMNPTTLVQDCEAILPGGVLFFPDHLKLPALDKDFIAYPMPVNDIVKEFNAPPKLRDYISNMVYVGVLSDVLGIDLCSIHEALEYHFKGKTSAVQSNFLIINRAAEWSKNNLQKIDSFYVEPMYGTKGYILTDGNTAGALGSIYGGVQFMGWYPITPATSLAEELNTYLPQLRKDTQTGKNTFVVVQAEDELAAIGMTIGAGWGGLRAMTSTSGPGLSLMAEYIGLAYFAEIPVVVWDVQRVGPSTGLPTRTAQSDVSSAYRLSHGDTQHILLFPGTVDECFEMGWKAFDIAERLQTPVLVLSDLDLGMNNWMCKEFKYPDKPMDRGKVLWEEDFKKILDQNKGVWGRYLDIDHDGIPYRTLPGIQNPKAVFFSRGTGHDEFAGYSEDPTVWKKNLNRLRFKLEHAADSLPAPMTWGNSQAKIGLLSYGSNDPAVQEARDLLLQAGLEIDYLRLRALPIHSKVREFIASHERVYVIENNRDAQMWQILVQTCPEYATRLYRVAHIDGLPLTALWIKSQISNFEKPLLKEEKQA